MGLQVVAAARAFAQRHDEEQVAALVIRFVLEGSRIEPRLWEVNHDGPRRPQYSALPSVRGQPLLALVWVVPQSVQRLVAPRIRSAICRCPLGEASLWSQECCGRTPVAEELRIQGKWTRLSQG